MKTEQLLMLGGAVFGAYLLYENWGDWFGSSAPASAGAAAGTTPPGASSSSAGPQAQNPANTAGGTPAPPAAPAAPAPSYRGGTPVYRTTPTPPPSTPFAGNQTRDVSMAGQLQTAAGGANSLNFDQWGYYYSSVYQALTPDQMADVIAAGGGNRSADISAAQFANWVSQIVSGPAPAPRRR